MFKKLLIASMVFSVGSSVAFAGHAYKGEDLKGEVPCPTYQYATGPYLGVSLGSRVNVTGTPTAFLGLDGILSGGWGWMLTPSWYLAGEIFGGGSAQLKNYKSPTGNGVKSSWTFGADIIPGYMITDHFLGYIRAGVARSRFQTQGTNSTGWQIGLGGQTEVYQNWDLRSEYIFTRYNSVTGIGNPMAYQFNVGLVYKFI